MDSRRSDGRRLELGAGRENNDARVSRHAGTTPTRTRTFSSLTSESCVMKLLVIEDDPRAASLLHKGLTEEGYIVDVHHDGEDGLEAACECRHDLIILDVMLPSMDGWTVLSHMRRREISTPVLMLTARDGVEHRIKGFSLGADDYLVKPFAFGELVGRIRSVLRRSVRSYTDILQFADLWLDARRHRVTRSEHPIVLSTKEVQLLELFLSHAGEVLSRTYISEKVWDMAFDCDSNVIDVNIRRLRSKIDDPFPRKLIHTIRGRGYVLR
jgi:two-component system copper resistance phosphate regulon response regulator CusR